MNLFAITVLYNDHERYGYDCVCYSKCICDWNYGHDNGRKYASCKTGYYVACWCDHDENVNWNYDTDYYLDLQCYSQIFDLKKLLMLELAF